jgi:hypothetical protein
VAVSYLIKDRLLIDAFATGRFLLKAASRLVVSYESYNAPMQTHATFQEGRKSNKAAFSFSANYVSVMIVASRFAVAALTQFRNITQCRD